MYVESLSSYARQFLGRMEKPDVEYIKGVAPAIAIQQKVSTKNPRSTVGTTTEIHDYLRLLWARVGETLCRQCGKPVIRESPDVVADSLLALPSGTRLLIGFDYPIVKLRMSESGDRDDDIDEFGNGRGRLDELPLEPRGDSPAVDPIAETIDGLRNVNQIVKGTRLPRVPEEAIEAIIHRDALALLGLA